MFQIKKILNQKGFTILESILTTALVAVGLMGGMLTMQNATLNTVNGDMNTVATQLASEKVDVIMADKSYNGYEFVSAENYPTEDLTAPYNMDRTVTVTEVNAEDLNTPEIGSGVKKVAVTVSWGEKDNQSVTMISLVSNYN